jgi:hypothetical protein
LKPEGEKKLSVEEIYFEKFQITPFC